MGLFSGVLGKVAGAVVGGLFGGNKKSQTTRSTVDYVALRKNAEAAGFNPLTALRNGGSAGFTQTHHPALSSGDVIGSAIGQGLQAGIQSAFDYNPLDEEKSLIERDIMRAQLRRINQTNDYYDGLGSVPAATGSRMRYGGGELTAKTQDRLKAGQTVAPEIEQPRGVNPYPADWNAKIDVNAPNTEMWEDRYGDFFGGIIGGVVTGWRDYVHTGPKRYISNREWQGRFKNPKLLGPKQGEIGPRYSHPRSKRY